VSLSGKTGDITLHAHPNEENRKMNKRDFLKSSVMAGIGAIAIGNTVSAFPIVGARYDAEQQARVEY
jgi:hypothetical protein